MIATNKEKGADYLKLIESIDRNDIALSFSSIKEFAKSPQHFVRYKLKSRKTTKAMNMGSLLDCLLTTPDEFDSLYAINDTGKPSGKSEIVIDCLLKGFELEDAIVLANYKTKPTKPAIDKIVKYVEFQKLNKGKTIISSIDYDTQRIKRDALLSNDAASWVINQVGQTQLKKEWKRYGFNWRGVLDMKGDGLVVDLKNIANHNPLKVKWTIRDMKYPLQGCLYVDAFPNEDLDYYIIATDDNLNVTVMQLDEMVLNTARQEIEQIVSNFKRCKFENAWHSSYDFYAENGVYKYSDTI